MEGDIKIAILGLWHLGEIYSACLAELGCKVVAVSPDDELVQNFKSGIAPLEEPLLKDMLLRNQSAGRLEFTADFRRIAEADVVWLALDVPVDEYDEADLTPIWKALETCIPFIKKDAVIAVSSQIPVGTSAKINRMLRESRPDAKFRYFYSPENLRLGEGVKSFMEPKRIVIGADDALSLEMAGRIFASLKAEMIPMSVASAEMTKHAINAWLATSISFANDLADACEHSGADVEDVIRALKAEPRIGEKAYIFAGLGFSGGTLGRDLKALMGLKREGIHLPVISSAYDKNAKRSEMITQRLEGHFGNIAGKTFAILGVTYKPRTSTLRRSLPLSIERVLRDKGAITRLCDPLALPHEVVEHSPSFFSRDPYETIVGADAVLVLTPDERLRELDFLKLASGMKRPVLFDAQNILIPKEAHIKNAGFVYWSVGRGAASI